MELEVLVATMGQTDCSLAKQMNLGRPAVIANQCGRWDHQEQGSVRMISTATKGVGINRNLALELAQGEGVPMENPGEPIAEDMLVFCGLHQAFLNQLLEVIRLGKFPPLLKAMLTEENKDWNSVQLRDELLEEKKKIEEAAAENAQ